MICWSQEHSGEAGCHGHRCRGSVLKPSAQNRGDPASPCRWKVTESSSVNKIIVFHYLTALAKIWMCVFVNSWMVSRIWLGERWDAPRTHGAADAADPPVPGEEVVRWRARRRWRHESSFPLGTIHRRTGCRSKALLPIRHLSTENHASCCV